MAEQTDSISVEELQLDCKTLETIVVKHGWASQDELDRSKPGGSENPDSGPRGWLRFFAVLHRHHSKGERMPGTGLSADADATILQVLRCEPHAVELVTLGKDGRPKYLMVHPKSFRTLIEISKMDYCLAWLVVQLGGWAESGKADDINLVDRALDEMRYQYEMLVWTLTTSGLGMPFDPNDNPRPQIPDEFSELDIMDLYRVAQAHALVHVTRLEALKHLTIGVDANGKRTRPSWSIFLDLASSGLEVELPRLMNDYSLPTVVAKAELRAAAQKESREKATEKAG